MGEQEYFAIKVMHVAESTEITERIEWCKENDIEFVPVNIGGCYIGGKYYTEEEMQEVGEIEIGKGAFINIATFPPINIGMGFVFYNEIDAFAFKLQWV